MQVVEAEKPPQKDVDYKNAHGKGQVCTVLGKCQDCAFKLQKKSLILVINGGMEADLQTQEPFPVGHTQVIPGALAIHCFDLRQEPGRDDCRLALVDRGT